MNYYEHHLGDYIRDAAHLSMLQEGAYRRLIDVYYIRERPYPLDPKEVCKLARTTTAAERAAVNYVLVSFFQRGPDGWRHKRCDQELARFKAKSDAGKANANARWSHRSGNGLASGPHANGISSASDLHRSGNALQTPDSSPQSPVTNLHPPHSGSGGGGGIKKRFRTSAELEADLIAQGLDPDADG